MLVLARKANESIEFPELDVKVRVVEVRGKRTVLGIEAPSEVRVLRGEIISHDGRNGETGGVVGRASSASKAGPRRTSSNGNSSSVPSAKPPSPAAAVAGSQSGWDEEIKRVELQLAALAELANAFDRRLARDIAGDAIERLGGLRQQLRGAAARQSEKRLPVKANTQRWPAAENRDEEGAGPVCVRQSSPGYANSSLSGPQAPAPVGVSPHPLAVAG